MTKSFKPVFTITNPIAAGLTRIERAWWFLEAGCLRAPKRQAALPETWMREIGRSALILEV
jgi:hypothetical protein